jgi:hypothetical protein
MHDRYMPPGIADIDNWTMPQSLFALCLSVFTIFFMELQATQMDRMRRILIISFLTSRLHLGKCMERQVGWGAGFSFMGNTSGAPLNYNFN